MLLGQDAICDPLLPAWAAGQNATRQYNGSIGSDLLNTAAISWISNTLLSPSFLGFVCLTLSGKCS